MTDQPPGGYPPPPSGGNPPPPPGGNYPPPGGYPPPPSGSGYPPPGAYPPPPPGSYPPPPGFGGYPPPPAGRPGGYPPPPPGGGYAGPGEYPPAGMAGPPPMRIGEALSWAFGKFTANAGPLIVATLAAVAALGVFQGIVNLLVTAVSPETTSTATVDGGVAFGYSADNVGFAGLIILLLGSIATLVLVAAIQSAYLAGVLDIADGTPVSIGSFFKPRHIGSVVIAGVLVGLITMIGTLLLVVPGILASIFLFFTTVAVVDRGLAPTVAIKTSFALTASRFGAVFLTWLVVNVAVGIGMLLCFVGLLVTVPVAALVAVYAFRRLSGAPVAA